MKYISLTNSSLTYFTAKGKMSELSGSSKYHVFNNEILVKEKSPNGKIENRSALLDYLQNTLTDKLTPEIQDRITQLYKNQLQFCKSIKYTSESALNLLEYYENLVNRFVKYGSEFPIKAEIINKTIQEQNCRYKTIIKSKSTDRKINKSKVRNKMFALFNLKCSRKFMAFYSVSFPKDTTDDEAFITFNYWLTCLRKKFGLTNYVWVSERQKNGILHFHMLTNNYMPILQINRAMAIIINNRVLENKMTWGASSMERYNGVDVDSIFNSKRHKKTGKNLNATQIRQWITAYITKYVTKNNEKFKHLCWHCSRSVSMLFTSTLLFIEESRKVTDYLPKLRHLYFNFKSEFNDTWIFRFVPPENIYEKIRLYNDLIFGEFVPEKYISKSIINYKTTTL